MNTGSKWTRVGTALLLGGAILWAGSVNRANATAEQKKSRKHQPELPPLPSGPTGRPVQPIPLDATPAVPPQVTYDKNQLTIVAPNSTLADILRAVRKLTGAEIEIPSAPERVVTNLGPGPARDIVAELLNGSRFNYILLGSPGNDAALTRIVLVAKTGAQEIPPPNPTLDPSLGPQASVNNQPPQPEQAQEPEAEAADDNSDDNADQNEADQQPPQAPDPNSNVKTPQQMLQEMQQRQMQLQQQQPPGQPPIPGAGRPPQQQDQ